MLSKIQIKKMNKQGTDRKKIVTIYTYVFKTTVKYRMYQRFLKITKDKHLIEKWAKELDNS